MSVVRGGDRLLQEVLLERHGQWGMLVGCIMLNRARGDAADRVWPLFFDEWPHPLRFLEDRNSDRVVTTLRPLGLPHRRAYAITRFTEQWVGLQLLGVPVTAGLLASLYGMGEYAVDSYRLFVARDLSVEPSDHALRGYLERHL